MTNILIIDTTSNPLHKIEFVNPIRDIVGKCKVAHYTKVTLKKLHEATHIIISGSALGETDYNLERFNWLKNTNRKVLGICSGIQIISLINQNKLKKFSSIGMTKIKTKKKNPLFEGNFEAYSLHNYGIDLPKNFEAIAKSSKEIQAIKHKTKPIYGVLFHPEVRNKKIIKNFISI